MKIIMLLLFFPLFAHAQEYRKFYNTFNITRSSRTDITDLILLLPCPKSNEYQSVYELDVTSNGEWNKCEIEENSNNYLELVLNKNQLVNYSQDFSVGYSFIHTPINIDIDFSVLKNSDGTWKDIPEYDTTTNDYQCNCKRSGNIVDPDNTTIKSISNRLYAECSSNKLAYAERCYEYVAANYHYLNPNTGLHPLTDLLSAGGGDCGNLSSIYISLLRAKGIPARHVVAIGDNNRYHVWAEFYIQNFGWVPVDVTYKNSDPRGNYFGKYNDNMVVVQKGVSMEYPISSVGVRNIDLLQTYFFLYWSKSFTRIDVSQRVYSENVVYSQISGITGSGHSHNKINKYFVKGKIMINRRGVWYNLSGMLLPNSNPLPRL